MEANGPQAPAKTVQFTDEQIKALSAYVASLAPGPAIPSQSELEGGNASSGGELFRINCSQCHQAAGQGGALTQGKYAPTLMNATPKEIWEAMVTGPQNMPAFGATLQTEDKQAIIKYIVSLQEAPNPGGLSLGRIGPVSEGLFLWTAALAALIGAAVWIGIKAR